MKKKYEKLYERNPFEDPYYVKLKDLHGFERLNYEISVKYDFYVSVIKMINNF